MNTSRTQEELRKEWLASENRFGIITDKISQPRFSNNEVGLALDIPQSIAVKEEGLRRLWPLVRDAGLGQSSFKGVLVDIEASAKKPVQHRKLWIAGTWLALLDWDEQVAFHHLTELLPKLGTSHSLDGMSPFPPKGPVKVLDEPWKHYLERNWAMLKLLSQHVGADLLTGGGHIIHALISQMSDDDYKVIGVVSTWGWVRDDLARIKEAFEKGGVDVQDEDAFVVSAMNALLHRRLPEAVTPAPIGAGSSGGGPKDRKPGARSGNTKPEPPRIALTWDDVQGDLGIPTWDVINPDQNSINMPVHEVLIRGVGMEPGWGGVAMPGSGHHQHKDYEGVAAKDIPYVAPKMVRVTVPVFEFFQHCAARARWQVCNLGGFHFTFTPLSVEKDDPSDCFHVVAVQRVVRLFRTPAEQEVYYNPRVRRENKSEPICYVVPPDWAAAIRQTWALGETIGRIGHIIPHVAVAPPVAAE